MMKSLRELFDRDKIAAREEEQRQADERQRERNAAAAVQRAKADADAAAIAAAAAAEQERLAREDAAFGAAEHQRTLDAMRVEALDLLDGHEGAELLEAAENFAAAAVAWEAAAGPKLEKARALTELANSLSDALRELHGVQVPRLYPADHFGGAVHNLFVAAGPRIVEAAIGSTSTPRLARWLVDRLFEGLTKRSVELDAARERKRVADAQQAGLDRLYPHEKAERDRLATHQVEASKGST